MKRELIIKALNGAIEEFKSEKGLPIWGDIVVDFNESNSKVGTYLTRHPGCIMLPVKLEEGSGYIFVRGITTIEGNSYFIAWEEDDRMFSLNHLLKGKASWDEIKEVSDFFDNLESKHL